MIETNTLIQWAEDLVAFANDAPSNPLFNSDDADPDWAEYALPEEARTTDQVASLRKAIRRRLAELAKWQPSKNRAPKVPSKLRGMAEGWLEDPLVQSTHRIVYSEAGRVFEVATHAAGRHSSRNGGM